MSDPNVYWGSGKGGTQVPLCNVVAAFGVDNTGATDTTAALQSAANKLPATSGQATWFPKGTYKMAPIAAQGVQISPAGLTLRAGTDVTITAAIPMGDDHTDSPFWCGWTNVTAGVTTTNGATVEGSRTVVVNSVVSLPVGGYVNFDGSSQAEPDLSFIMVGVGATGTANITAGGLYGGGGTLNGTTLILNVAGAGALTLNLNGATNAANLAALLAAIAAEWPALSVVAQGPGSTGTNLVLCASSLVVGAGTANAFLGLSTTNNTIELDAPVLMVFPTATPIDTGTPPLNVSLDFNGATLSGTGARAFWIQGGWYSLVENLVVQSSFTSFGPDYDEGGRSCTMRLVKCYCTDLAIAINRTQVALALEGGQNHLLDRCEGYNAKGAAFQIGGINHVVRDCIGADAGVGVALQHTGSNDLVCARYCKVEGGDYSANAIGAAISDNSFGNTLEGFTATGNTTYGVQLYTGTFLTATTGVSNNIVRGVIANLSGQVGFQLGNPSGANLAHDGNQFIACQAIGTGAATGFRAQKGPTNTSYVGCIATGAASGAGFVISDASVTGTVFVGCKSEGNATGYSLGGTDHTLVGCSSINDLSDPIITGSGRTVWTGGRLAANSSVSSSWTGLLTGSGDVWFTETVIDITGAVGAGIIGIQINGTGATYLENVKIVGGAVNSTGLYCGSSGPVFIGPGCDFDGTATPIGFHGTNVVTMAQTGGVAAVATLTGTKQLTFKQHYCTAIETSGVLSGNLVVTCYPFPGLTFQVSNANTGAFTTTVKSTTDAGAGVTVAQGKTAIVRVNSAGNVVRVTADT